MSNRNFVIALLTILLVAFFRDEIANYFHRLNPVAQTAGQWATGEYEGRTVVYSASLHSYNFSKGSVHHIFYETISNSNGEVIEFTPYRIEVNPPFDGPLKNRSYSTGPMKYFGAENW